ncbi:MAG TPA: hypothetical protein IGS53_26530 [Leptolyngbyaceae cyanobacterium M33_DOE_097]|uniref:Uncharacterized protein n=1 Tax=Oscillatoriales cyanobacterium SpSt-418 TaxID=2282169 RepID=A0A7C3PHG5_9CYAN|nr:hypothetical protein [Leptolyngbyaceae cyanobacterium M33_DOE_097]
MSWDLFLLRPLPTDEALTPASEVFSKPLGRRGEVIALLQEICRQVSFNDPEFPNQGHLSGDPELQGEDYSIDFSLWEKDGLIYIIETNSRRCFGEQVIEVLDTICQKAGWQAFDSLSERFIDLKTGEELEGWKIPEPLVVEEIDWEDPQVQAAIATLKKTLNLV